MEIIKNNLKIKAHTLLLIDIGLGIEKAKLQIHQASQNYDVKLPKIILCEQLGINAKITYDALKNLPNFTKHPYCFIIPSELNLMEQEFLKNQNL